jgi:hypothetical protein
MVTSCLDPASSRRFPPDGPHRTLTIFFMLDGQGAIVQPDADGPEAADLLEV